jgi:hypothetical protein
MQGQRISTRSARAYRPHLCAPGGRKTASKIVPVRYACAGAHVRVRHGAWRSRRAAGCELATEPIERRKTTVTSNPPSTVRERVPNTVKRNSKKHCSSTSTFSLFLFLFAMTFSVTKVCSLNKRSSTELVRDQQDKTATHLISIDSFSFHKGGPTRCRTKQLSLHHQALTNLKTPRLLPTDRRHQPI